MKIEDTSLTSEPKFLDNTKAAVVFYDIIDQKKKAESPDLWLVTFIICDL